jgi:hypothetical protein
MRLRQISCLVVCLAAVAVFTGCGTPGAPQLPSLQLARPVDDLNASRKGVHVQLDWTLPRKNTDRTLVKHIPEVRICRHEGTVLMSECTEVARIATPKMPPWKKQKGETEPKAVRMNFVDTLPAELGQRHPGGFVLYAVEILNQHGRSAGLSNQVLIPVAPTLPPPEEISADVNANGVRITWNGGSAPPAPAGLTYQYRIMRKPESAPAYIAVTDIAPATSGAYLDRTSGWEQKYEYRITTVTLVHANGINAAVEGGDSQPFEVFTKDIYPPAQPVGLQAVFSSVGQKPFVDLTWAPNTDGDLAGYNVYRRIEGGAPEKLNRQVVATPSYRDEAVETGKKYVYFVSAVDLRGNEGPHSADTVETVPNKP